MRVHSTVHERRPTLRTLLRDALVRILVVTLAISGPGSWITFAQSAVPSEVDAARAEIDVLRGRLDRVESALPDVYLDHDELAFDLAFEDADVIATWVRDEIGYQPYRGVLRGAEGTVLSRAGNAWDQALLLVGLLLDAGYEARIVSATLGDEGVDALLAEIAPSSDLPVDDSALRAAFAGEDDGIAETLRELSERAPAPSVPSPEARAVDAAGWLQATLSEAGVAVGGDDLSELRAGAADYAWVQVQAIGSETWTDLHPALTRDSPWTADLEPERFLEGEIPAEVQHRFRVQAVIERRAGSELETIPVMAAWERPVANLNGVAMTYVAIPNGYVSAGVGALPAEAYAATTMAIPLFNGDEAPGAQLFDHAGNVVPPDAVASPAAGLVQTVGSRFGDALGAIGDEEDVPVLTAHWLEFTLIEPGGEETTYRRTLFDRLGETRRVSGDVGGELDAYEQAEVYEQLHQLHTFMLAPGSYPEAYVARRAVDGARMAVDYLDAAWVSATLAQPVAAEPPSGLATEVNGAPVLRLFRAFDDLPSSSLELREGETLVSYRARPALVASVLAADGRTANVDVVQNVRTSIVTSSDGTVTPSFDGNVLAGTWETALEPTALAGTGRIQDTFTFFGAVQSQEIGVRTLVPGTDLAEGLALPDASLRAIELDLDRGYVVVAAEAMPEGAEIAAWWRIDPRTGETLGRGADGRGNVISDYGVLIGFSLSVFLGFVGFGSCMASSGGELGCCSVDAAIGFTAGLIVAPLLFIKATALIGLIGGALLDATALGLGVAGKLPSLCSVTGSATGNEDAATSTLRITAGGSARETEVASCRVRTDWTTFLPAFRTLPVAAAVRLG